MSLFYVTGVPGTGKSAVETALKQRGYEAYDIDQPRFGGPTHKATGKPATVPPIEGRNTEWYDQHEWRVSRPAIEELKEQSKSHDIYLCGTASTENLVWDLFDKVMYLNVDEATLRSRILGRDDGYNFGKTSDEMRLILERHKAAQDNLSNLDASTFIIDATKPVSEVVDTIIREAVL